MSKKSRQALKDKIKGSVKKVTTKEGLKSLATSLKHQATHPGETLKNMATNYKGELKDLGKRIGDNLGGGVAVHALNKYDPYFIAIRGAVISVLDLNVVGIATSLALVKDDSDKSHWEKIAQKWWLLGGEKEGFAKAIDKGKGKKQLFIELLGKKHHLEHADAQDVAKVVSASAAGIGAIGGILASLPDPEPIVKTVGGYMGVSGGVLSGLAAGMGGFAAKKGATKEQLAAIPAPVSNQPVITDQNGIAKPQPKELDGMGLPPLVIPHDENRLNDVQGTMSNNLTDMHEKVSKASEVPTDEELYGKGLVGIINKLFHHKRKQKQNLQHYTGGLNRILNLEHLDGAGNPDGTLYLPDGNVTDNEEEGVVYDVFMSNQAEDTGIQDLPEDQIGENESGGGSGSGGSGGGGGGGGGGSTAGLGSYVPTVTPVKKIIVLQSGIPVGVFAHLPTNIKPVIKPVVLTTKDFASPIRTTSVKITPQIEKIATRISKISTK